MISFGNEASSHSDLIPLKTAYNSLTCIQPLLIQFLDVIWSIIWSCVDGVNNYTLKESETSTISGISLTFNNFLSNTSAGKIQKVYKNL